LGSTSDSVDERQPELVKYIPQNFLEKICTQLGKIEESDFDQELKKVIFSHVEAPFRLGQSTLNGLIAYKTTESSAKGDILKQELHKINEEIIALEEKTEPVYQKKLENLLDKKRKELAAHDAAKPTAVTKPENDPTTQKHIVETTQAIDKAKGELAAAEASIVAARNRQSALAQQKSIADRVSARLDNLQRQITVFLSDSREDFVSLGLSPDDVLRVMIDKVPLTKKHESIQQEQGIIELSLDPSQPKSFADQKGSIETHIQQLQSALDEPNLRYQAYEAALRAWGVGRSVIVGDEESLDTIVYYEAQIADLDRIPSKLAEARCRRLAKSKEIHEVITALGDTYRELYAPVNKFIEERPLARDKFQLNFEVGIVDSGFQEGLFEFISQSVAGTFCGVESGSKMLKEILGRQDFNSVEGVEAFLLEITEALHSDRRSEGKAVRVTDQLRKGKSVLALYDFVFSLGYIKPRYALRMGTKELSELSPGERGTLLLVFYLLVDKDDIPLVIDQPEENLDNQTVYELLVPCMKEAKRRRQVLIVTHNPNLAVVCDAEQVICAALDKANNYTMTYLSGAIENPRINRAIVDILEGTMPAFQNREDKYFVSFR
jgi:hypothetical protein